MAFVEFGSTVFQTQQPTNKEDVFDGWVASCDNYAHKETNAAHTQGGTNWEAALNAANNIVFKDDDPVYIVFVTDGNPTLRNKKFVENGDEDDGPRAGEHSTSDSLIERMYADEIIDGVYGTGTNDEKGYNLLAANDVADTILNSGKTLYVIGIFGDADKINSLHGSDHFEGSDDVGIRAAFDSIVSSLSSYLSYSDVSITDGITSLTTSTFIKGAPAAFNYSATKNGEPVAMTDGQKQAQYVASPDDVNESGKIVWNLGDDEVVPGATYTLTTTIWPSQEAYDLMADLNNGTKTYAGLPQWQRDQLIDNGDGSYSLRTNTSVEASCKVKTSETGTPTDQNINVTETLTPMPLDDSRVTIQKVWDATLDESQLEDIVDFTAELKLVREKGGVSAQKEDFITGITISAPDPFPVTNKKSVWPENNPNGHYISAGLMISYDNAESTGLLDSISGYPTKTGSDGKTYYILETGHNYYFEEETADYRFELKPTVWRPMVVDGDIQDVAFEGDNVVLKGTLDTLTADNQLKGGIQFRKQVIDGEGNDISDKVKQKFKITVVLKNPDGSDYHAHEGIGGYRINYGTMRPASEKDFGSGTAAANNEARNRSQRYPISDGGFWVEIYTDEYVQVANVDRGTTYEVVEADGDVPSGYQRGDVIYDSDDHTMTSNTSHQVTVQNIKPLGSLIINKTVLVDNNPPSTDAEKQLVNGDYIFTVADANSIVKYVQITVTNGAPSSYRIADTREGLASAEVKDGGVASVPKLAEGDYVITEIEKNGMTLKEAARGDGDASAVSADKAVTVHVTVGQADAAATLAASASFTNNIETVTARITKVWNHTGNDGTRPTSLLVTLSNGETRTLNEGNSWTAEITDLPKYDRTTGALIDYSWTEEELPAGYYLSSIQNSNAAGIISTTLTNSFTDHYNPMIEITGKKVWDDGGVNRPDSIIVNLYKDGGATPYRTVTIQAPTGEGANQDEWTFDFTNLPVFNEDGSLAQYTIEEVLPAGYSDEYGVRVELSQATYVAGTASYEIVNTYNEDQKIAEGTDLGFVVIRHGNDFVVWTQRPLQSGELDTIKNTVKNASNQFNKIMDSGRTITLISGMPKTVDVGSKHAVSVYMKEGGIWIRFLTPSAESDIVYGKIPYTYTKAGGEGGGIITNTKKTTDLEFGKQWIDMLQREIDWDQDIQVTVNRLKSDGSRDNGFSLVYDISKAAVNSASGGTAEFSTGSASDPKLKLTVTTEGTVKKYSFKLEELQYFSEADGKYTYYVEETNSQLDGYLAPSSWNSSAPTGAAGAFDKGTIINRQEGGFELPSTGGHGTGTFALLGTAITAGAGLLLRKRRKTI